jgi:acetyl-CoA carboxylase biotin carboxyl carrier protein
VDLKDIKAIVDLMKKNAITEFEMERDGFKIRLKRAVGQTVASEEPVANVLGVPLVNGPAHPPAVAAAPAPAAPPATPEVEIKSPMIGTFYRAPSPEAAPYVDVGSVVEPDTVVCIIEAMKVMNEIKAELKGVITDVLVENGKPVEFGQPLFRVRPA